MRRLPPSLFEGLCALTEDDTTALLPIVQAKINLIEQSSISKVSPYRIASPYHMAIIYHDPPPDHMAIIYYDPPPDLRQYDARTRRQRANRGKRQEDDDLESFIDMVMVHGTDSTVILYRLK